MFSSLWVGSERRRRTGAAPFINILSWFGGLRWLAAYGVIEIRNGADTII
jgi:hypothetical protein